MPQDKLTPYWIRLNSQKKPGLEIDESDYFDLIDFGETNEGFAEYNTFADYLYERLVDLHDSGHHNETADKTLTVRQVHYAGPGDSMSSSDGHTIEAVLAYGKLGRPGDHLDTEGLDQPSNTPDDLRDENVRGQTTSAEERLYFAFHVSESEPSRGMTIFHNYGGVGAKSVLYGVLKRHLTGCYVKPVTDSDRGLTFHMNTVASRSLIDQLSSDTLTGFELAQRSVPTEEYRRESSILGGSGDAKITYKIEREGFSLDREQARQLVASIENNEYPYGELLQQNNDEKQVSRVNAIVESAGDHDRKRRLTQGELRVEEILDEDDIEYDNDGRVSMSSISHIAREMANEQLNEYGAPTLDASESLFDN